MFLYHLNTNLCFLVYSVMTIDKTKFKSVCETAPKIFVLGRSGPHLRIRIWVRAMIWPVKNAIVDLQKGKFEKPGLEVNILVH